MTFTLEEIKKALAFTDGVTDTLKILVASKLEEQMKGLLAPTRIWVRGITDDGKVIIIGNHYARFFIDLFNEDGTSKEPRKILYEIYTLCGEIREECEKGMRE